MLEHRFRQLLTEDETQSLFAGPRSATAFMLCPCPVPQPMSPVAEQLYRLAYEQAQAQVASVNVRRWSEFSLN
jgi:hypothetical protein